MFNINSIFKRKNYEDILYKKYGTANKIQRYKLEFNDLFDMNEKILDICEEKNIKLNFDKYDGACVGLPYDIPFIKE